MKIVCDCGWETKLEAHPDRGDMRFTPIWLTGGDCKLICANCRLTIIRYGAGEPSATETVAVGNPPEKVAS